MAILEISSEVQKASKEIFNKHIQTLDLYKTKDKKETISLNEIEKNYLKINRALVSKQRNDIKHTKENCIQNIKNCYCKIEWNYEKNKWWNTYEYCSCIKNEELKEYNGQKNNYVFYNANIDKEHLLDFNKIIVQPGQELAYNNLKARINNPNDGHNGYYLYGAMGVGKTYLLKAFANNMAKQNKTIAFCLINNLFNDFRDSFRNEVNKTDMIINILKKVDVLVLDDIGAEYSKEWQWDILFNILDYRMGNNLATYFSSNKKQESLAIQYRQVAEKDNINLSAVTRIMERICKISKDIQVQGSNLRDLPKLDKEEDK